MSSERLPGKALAEFGGSTQIGHVARRLLKSKSVRTVVLATSTGKEDDALAEWGVRAGLPVYRGPLDDVVTRFNGAVQKHFKPGDLVLRALGDQPFLDWDDIDIAASLMENRGWDFLVPLSFGQDPIYGAAVSPWSMATWSWIVGNSRGEEREHVGMRLRRDMPRFKYGLRDIPHWQYRPYRLEVDTPADRALASSIWDIWLRTHTPDEEPPLRWVVDLLDRQPALAALNASVHEKTGTFTSFTQAEVEAWERDYRGREVVFSDAGGLEGQIADGPPGKVRCSKCDGALVVSKLDHGDLELRCLRCGRREKFFGINPGGRR